MAKNNEHAAKRGNGRSDGAARQRAARARMSAAEEAEAQLASLHGEERSVLDRLPKAVGPAGVPRSARPVPTASEPQPHAHADAHGHHEHEHRRTHGHASRAQRDAPRDLVTRGADAPRLSPLQRRLVRTFPPLFRAIGTAAGVLDRPLRQALDTLQWLGRAARNPT